MEKQFSDAPPVRVAAHPQIKRLIAVGFLDGHIGFCLFDPSENELQIAAARKLKRAVREIEFSRDGEHLYSISENRALCVYDVQQNKRVRCIREAHDDKPNSMCQLPSSSTKGQQVATGDESGQIRTWDLRTEPALISTYSDQEEPINSLAVCDNLLLAASSDGTLGAYEMRRRKLQVRSEPMHNELLSIGVADKFTYVGSGDGHLEVFRNGEYGNLLERMDTGHQFGVDCIQILRPGVILTASNEEPELRLLHVNPSKRLGIAGLHCGCVQQVKATIDSNWLISVGWIEPTIKFWDLKHLLDKIPIVRASEMKKMKGKGDFVNLREFDDFWNFGKEKTDDRSDDDEEEGEEDAEDEGDDSDMQERSGGSSHESY